MDRTGHPSFRELEQYAARQLPPSELLAVDDHLANCPSCRALVAQDLPGGELELKDADAHLSYEEMEAFAEGRISVEDRQLTEQHLADCEMCESEVRDLQALINGRTRGSRLRRWWLPAGSAVAAGVVIMAFLTHRPTVEPPPRPAAILTEVIQDGPLRFEIGPQIRIDGATLSSPDQGTIMASLRSGALPLEASAQRWNRLPEALLGDTAPVTPAVTSPIAETVESDRPVFRWRPVKDAQSYRVEVYDPAFNESAASGNLHATEWQPARPLKRGQTYSWVVAAHTASGEVRFPQPPAPEAKFAVLAPDGAAAMSHARESSSLLLLAVTAARYGIWSDAQIALDRLSHVNPSSGTLDRLRRSVPAAAVQEPR